MSEKINEQKFLEFYDQYVDKIYRYIFFRLGSEEMAKDLTSEVFLKMARLTKELEAQFEESDKLEQSIRAKLQTLDYGK